MAGIVSLSAAQSPPLIRRRRRPRRRLIRKEAVRALKFLDGPDPPSDKTISQEIYHLMSNIENDAADRFRKTWGFDIKAGEPVRDNNSPWKWTEL